MATLVRSRITELLFGAGLAWFCLVTACVEKLPVVNATDPRLSVREDRLYLLGQPYTGTLRENIPAMRETRTTPYLEGQKHGLEIVRHDSGQELARGAYVAGQKHGVHRTWYASGGNRGYAQFEHGRYTGERLAWHENGRAFEYERFDEAGRAIASKRWRRNGLIYMNVVLQKDGEQLGLPGSKVCEPTNQAPKK